MFFLYFRKQVSFQLLLYFVLSSLISFAYANNYNDALDPKRIMKEEIEKRLLPLQELEKSSIDELRRLNFLEENLKKKIKDAERENQNFQEIRDYEESKKLAEILFISLSTFLSSLLPKFLDYIQFPQQMNSRIGLPLLTGFLGGELLWKKAILKLDPLFFEPSFKPNALMEQKKNNEIIWIELGKQDEIIDKKKKASSREQKNLGIFLLESQKRLEEAEKSNKIMKQIETYENYKKWAQFLLTLGGAYGFSFLDLTTAPLAETIAKSILTFASLTTSYFVIDSSLKEFCSPDALNKKTENDRLIQTSLEGQNKIAQEKEKLKRKVEENGLSWELIQHKARRSLR